MASPEDAFCFMPAGGATGALVRAVAWQDHPLGLPAHWPKPLRTVLGILFGSRHPMVVWWGDALYQFYNDGYLPHMAGGRHPAAMGQRAELCWQDIWPIIAPQIHAVFAEKKSTWHEDQKIPTVLDGVSRDAYWTYGFSPILDDDGAVSGCLVTCNDTTSRVLGTQDLSMAKNRLLQSERTLRAAQQNLQDFLTQAPVGVAILSGPDHVFTFINPLFMDLLFGGKPIDAFVNKTVRQVLPEIGNQGYHEILDHVYRTGEPFRGAKHRALLVQADGSERELFVNFAYQPKRTADGHIDALLVIVYEVTDQVNEQREIEVLAENLRAAITSRDTFLGVASHELNTPLTALKLQTQLSKRALERPGDLALCQQRFAKLLEETRIHTGRLERLVGDMLDVSRIQAGNLAMKLGYANLSACLAESLQRLTPHLEAAGCRLTVELRADVWTRFDAGRIDQVISNLLTNALKYAPLCPVHVCLAVVGDDVQVSVQDGGGGIQARDLPRVFGRFERATPASEVSGLGLGLYICKEIMAQHGGDILVHSVVGEGATFTFSLPACESADDASER